MLSKFESIFVGRKVLVCISEDSNFFSGVKVRMNEFLIFSSLIKCLMTESLEGLANVLDGILKGSKIGNKNMSNSKPSSTWTMEYNNNYMMSTKRFFSYRPVRPNKNSRSASHEWEFQSRTRHTSATRRWCSRLVTRPGPGRPSTGQAQAGRAVTA
jgi:hypothetical protein